MSPQRGGVSEASESQAEHDKVLRKVGMFLLCRNRATFWNECRVVNVTSSESSSVDLNMNVLWAVGKSDTTWGWAE